MIKVKQLDEAIIRKINHDFKMEFKRARIDNSPSIYHVYEEVRDGQGFYLILCYVSKSDEYYVEIGWSRRGVFPYGRLPGMRPIDIPELQMKKSTKDISRGEFLCRLNMFFSPRSWKYWSLENIEEFDNIVNDVVSKLSQYALPFFEELKNSKPADGAGVTIPQSEPSPEHQTGSDTHHEHKLGTHESDSIP